MLEVGDRAPGFKLATPDGKTYQPEGLTLAVFFKTNCPTCQYAWPFYQRLDGVYGKSGLELLGISQNDAERTRAFGGEYGSTFPLLIDEGHKAAAAYGPDFVPTAFLVQNGQVAGTCVAWNRELFEQLGMIIAERLGVEPRPLIKPDEPVIAFKPG